MNKIDLQRSSAYDEDFALWAAQQGALLRAGKLDQVDIENLAEEIETLGRSERHEIQSRLTVILVHLLKWEHQPEASNNSWAASIIENRDRIAQLIEESPSLHSFPAAKLAASYKPAPSAASGETGLPLDRFPKQCPYSIEQVLDEDFWPGHLPR